MQIEIDAATRAEIIRQVTEQVTRETLAKVMAQIDHKQIAAEVKNAAMSRASNAIADKVYAKYDGDTFFKNAIASVEGRINGRIKMMLEQGIKISFREPA